MQIKVSLKAEKELSREFVSINCSHHLYCDKYFFETKMNENPKQNRSFPVEVRAIQIDCLNSDSDEILKFLKAIHNSENLELYKNKFI